MIEPSELAGLRIRPLRRVEFERLVDLGVFEDERIELLRGVLVEKMTEGSPHAEITVRLNEWLLPALRSRARVRVNAPYAATDDSEPEPDVAIVPKRDYSTGHPMRAYLVIEVSDSSLAKDRGLKAGIYAEAGIPEYWVLDVEAKCVHVHQKPQQGRYTRVTSVDSSGTLRVGRFPDIHIHVARLLTRTKRRQPRSRRR